MSKKTIEDLRAHLFEAIAGVKAGTTTLEQAKMIGELSQVIVNTVKVEFAYVRAARSGKSQFIAVTADEVTTKPQALPNGILGIRRHVCADD